MPRTANHKPSIKGSEVFGCLVQFARAYDLPLLSSMPSEPVDVEEEAPLLPRSRFSGPDVATQTVRKLNGTVLLLCTGVIFLAYVDRSNIGYAARDLCNDIHLNHREYGLGVSLFYGGYVLSQVSGNVILARIGAPAWLSLIVLSSGAVSICLGLLQTKLQFYIQRVLLGVTQGGIIPAVWYFLSLFYPPDHLTSAYTCTVAAVALSMPLASPLSAGLISLGPLVGVEGWRLLFISAGLMPIGFSVVLYVFLPRNPQSMHSLKPEEKEWIVSELGRANEPSTKDLIKEIKTVLFNLPWWRVTLCYLLAFGVESVLSFWATLMVHDMLHGDDRNEDSKTCGSGDGDSAISILLTGIPYLFGGLVCLCVKGYTIRDRAKFSAFVKATGGLVLVSWLITRRVAFAFGLISLTLAIGSNFITTGPIAALALSFFDGATQSTASSLLCAVSSAGALFFPPIVGILLDSFGYDIAILVCGCLCVLAGMLVFSITDPLAKPQLDQQ